MKNLLTIICARGGSKGLPRKNILDFDGKPLIHWSIRAALDATRTDRVVVSTDDEEIAEAARAAGAEVPFMRPAELATDTASTRDAILHALDWFEKNESVHFDYLLALQPTTPLRTARHIDEALALYEERSQDGTETMVGVVAADPEAGWTMRQDEDGFVHFLLGDAENTPRRRQDLPSLFLPNGTIHLTPTDKISAHAFYSEKTIPYIFPRGVSVDIDDRADFNRALEIRRNSQ